VTINYKDLMTEIYVYFFVHGKNSQRDAKDTRKLHTFLCEPSRCAILPNGKIYYRLKHNNI